MKFNEAMSLLKKKNIILYIFFNSNRTCKNLFYFNHHLQIALFYHHPYLAKNYHHSVCFSF